jgi:hypothetical protein
MKNMDRFKLADTLEYLLKISTDVDITEISVDECDSSVSLKIKDGGKIKSFLIEIKDI